MNDVKSGIVDIDDLRKLNALLDMQSDVEAAQYEEANSKN